MSADNPQRIEAEIARNREELKTAVDELSDRLNPRSLAHEAADEAKIAAMEIKRRVSGDVRPPDEPEPTRTGWVVLGTGAAIATWVFSKIVRKL